MVMEPIDFVILWVDGGDPEWQAEFLRHKGGGATDSSVARYRDWDNLHYWFRAVERFAPWVNRVHFITWRHLPEWLDAGNPKLNIVNHRDYIPGKYLPTFNSNAIELNIYRIEGLAEHFVLFNDDVFLGNEVAPERFFRRGLPVDMARLAIIQPGGVSGIETNCTEMMNRRHRKYHSIFGHPAKWFNLRYRLSDIVKTFSLLPYPLFSGVRQPHMPQPYLRSSFERMWREEGELFDSTCSHKFRDQKSDVSHWAVRMDVLARGEFAPHGMRDVHLDLIGDGSIDRICDFIERREYAMFCINDSNDIADFETLRDRLKDSFNAILPAKSSFEK